MFVDYIDLFLLVVVVVQVDACNQLNINLTNQISEMTKKYNNAVLVFCGVVLAVALLLFWLFLQYHNGSVSPPSPVEEHSSPSNTLFNTKSPVQSSYMSSTTSGHNIRYDSVLIISTSLYESLEESGWNDDNNTNSEAAETNPSPDGTNPKEAFKVDNPSNSGDIGEGTDLTLGKPLAETMGRPSRASVLGVLSRVGGEKEQMAIHPAI